MKRVDFRSFFNIDSEVINMNSGTESVCPRTVMDSIQVYQRAYERNPTEGLLSSWGNLWQVQKSLAQFLGANPKDLFLRNNITAVLNIIILGAPLPPGGEILVSNLEYGAIVNICKARCLRDKRELRAFKLPFSPEHLEKLTSEDLADLVVSQLKPQTRMLVLSHVISANGMVLPIVEIAAETRRRGIKFVVDGAHAPGVLSMDFGKFENIDYYGANLHKWMLGPKCTAFGWAHPQHQSDLDPLFYGWTSFETPEYFTDFGDNSRFASKLLMLGCHDFAPFFAIQDTLDFWNQVGPKAIREKIYSLQSELQALADMQLHWPLFSPPAGPLRGPLLTYALPQKAQNQGIGFMKMLWEEHRLQINMPFIEGHWCMRLSPHIYNTEDELQRAIKILNRFKEDKT